MQAQGSESDRYLGLVSALGISPLSKPLIAELPELPPPATPGVSAACAVSSATGRATRQPSSQAPAISSAAT
ncbi:hypothetical protein EDD84_30185 [Burkholderia gladioli]|nr:hypothetical protein EDD84_30185 [Burkholderia gladioli]